MEIFLLVIYISKSPVQSISIFEILYAYAIEINNIKGYVYFEKKNVLTTKKEYFSVLILVNTAILPQKSRINNMPIVLSESFLHDILLLRTENFPAFLFVCLWNSIKLS